MTLTQSIEIYSIVEYFLCYKLRIFKSLINFKRDVSYVTVSNVTNCVCIKIIEN